MQLFQTRSKHPTAEPVVLDPAERISDQLLKHFRGEVLVINSNQSTIYQRSAGNMRQRSLSWLNMVANAKCTRFIAGRVSEKGGRFRIVTRAEALQIIARWLFEDLQNLES